MAERVAPTPLPISPYIEFIRGLDSLPEGTPSSDTLDIMAWTMLGEAANQGNKGLQAIANVLVNRSESGRYPADLKKVALQDRQFSTWNKGEGGNNPKGRYPKSSEAFQNARRIAADVVSGRRPDITGGATHYWSPSGMTAMGYAETPYWAKGEKTRWGTLEIGDHVFLPRKPVPPADIPTPPQPLDKPKSIRLQQAMNSILDDEPRALPAPAPLTFPERARYPIPPTIEQVMAWDDGGYGTPIQAFAFDRMADRDYYGLGAITGQPPKAPPKAPVEGLIKLRPGRDLREQSWGVGGANQAGTNRMGADRPSIIDAMYEDMGVEIKPNRLLDRFNTADIDGPLDFASLQRDFLTPKTAFAPTPLPREAGDRARLAMSQRAPVPLPRPAFQVDRNGRVIRALPNDQRQWSPLSITVTGGRRSTPTQSPGFAQRAAAASARESLMNPSTETNWAAIEASAKSRR